jgi:hypothetical protein
MGQIGEGVSGMDLMQKRMVYPLSGCGADQSLVGLPVVELDSYGPHGNSRQMRPQHPRRQKT